MIAEKMAVLDRSLQNGLNFVNANLPSILPFSILFFVAALTYSISWYTLDMFREAACVNGNYVVELLFCNLYLGILGKHILSVVLSSFVIVPFAALVYLTNNMVGGKNDDIVESLRGSLKGLLKIIVFRVALTLIVFAPFIIFLVFGGDVITQRITSTGRLTIEKMLTVQLLPIPVSLLLGFTLLALFEPVFQYVEYEVLVGGARVRDAVRNSYRVAMKYKAQTFIFGLLCVLIWDMFTFMKFLYMAHPFLTISLLAAIFLESFLFFPVRATSLYFLWRELKGGYTAEVEDSAKRQLRTYMGKMMLG